MTTEASLGSPRVGQREASPAWLRLEDQLQWYDRKSVSCQRRYKWAKLAQLIIGSSVPVIALANSPAVITASVSAAVVVIEGLQQVNQWQTNWVLYRSTAESLKHERSLYLSEAGPYRSDDRDRVLAERLEGLVSQEHAKWTHTREECPDWPGDTGAG
jgi:hypothetical protein